MRSARNELFAAVLRFERQEYDEPGVDAEVGKIAIGTLVLRQSETGAAAIAGDAVDGNEGDLPATTRQCGVIQRCAGHFYTDQGAHSTSAVTERGLGAGVRCSVDGPWPVSRQCFHCAVVAFAEVRGCLPMRKVRRRHRRVPDRSSVRLLQRGETTLIVEWRDARRSLLPHRGDNMRGECSLCVLGVANRPSGPVEGRTGCDARGLRRRRDFHFGFTPITTPLTRLNRRDTSPALRVSSHQRTSCFNP